MTSYVFKTLEEAGWAAVVAAAVFVLQVLSQFDPEVVTDWHTWAIAFGAGVVRAAAGAALSVIRL